MSGQRLFLIATSLLVTLAVLAGLYVTGSPARQRQLRFDERRVADLRLLSAQIRRYAERFGRVPATLDDLLGATDMQRLPGDPATGEDYEYRVTSESGARLCAYFALPGTGAQGEYAWSHGAGHDCVDLSTGARAVRR